MAVVPFEVARRICDVLGISHVRSIDIHLEVDQVAVMKIEILPDGNVLNGITDILLEAKWEKR